MPQLRIITSFIIIFSLILPLNLFALQKDIKDHYSAEKECAKTLTPAELKDSTVLTVIGVYCFDAQRYLIALKYYRLAYSLSKSPFLLGAMGRVFEELGYHSNAAGYYRRFLQEVPYSDGRIAARLKHIDTLLDQSGYNVTLSTTPPGANISLIMNQTHWESLGETPARMTLLPGSYDFVFHKPGWQTRHVTVDIPGDLTNTSHFLNYNLSSINDMYLQTPQHRWRDLAVATYLASIPVLIGGGVILAIGYDHAADVPHLPTRDQTSFLQKASLLKAVGYSVLGLGLAGIVTATTFQLLSISWSSEGDKASKGAKGPSASTFSAAISPLGVELNARF